MSCFHFYILFSCTQTCLLHKKKQVGYRVTLSQAIFFEMKQNDSLIAVPMHIPLEKAMATHSSILAWRIPWMEEPGGLQSMGCKRVGHNLETKQQCTYHLSFDTEFPIL